MKKLIGSLVLVLLWASPIHAGPNAAARWTATLDKSTGVKAGDTVTLTISATGLNTCSGFTAEVLYDSNVLGDPESRSIQPFLAPGKTVNVITTVAGYNRSTVMGAAQIGGATTAAGPTNLATFSFVTKTGFTTANVAIRQFIFNSEAFRDTILASPSPLILRINGGSAGGSTQQPTVQPLAGGAIFARAVVRGKNFDIHIQLTKDYPNTTAFSSTVEYPPQLGFVSAKLAGVFVGATTPGVDVSVSGQITFGAAFLGQTVTARGTIATLTFQPRPDFSGNLTLSLTKLKITPLFPGTTTEYAPGALVGLTTDVTEQGLPPALLGDLNGDGVVDFEDFFLFAQNFGRKL